jgi:hypothetical protein
MDNTLIGKKMREPGSPGEISSEGKQTASKVDLRA